MSHLPYEVPEDDYREDAEARYREIHGAVDDALDGSDVAAGGFVGTVVTWLSTRQRSAGVRPSGADQQWFDDYPRRAYSAGRQYARDELSAAGHSPSRTSLTRSTAHQRALSTLQDRQRRYWRKLASDLREEVRSALRNDVAANASISEAQDAIRDRIEKTGLDRARRIAETEPAWGFNRAYLAEAQEAGVDRVAVDMSWETAGDEKVCASCASKSGSYSMNKAIQMMESGAGIPDHSLCRCRWVVA